MTRVGSFWMRWSRRTARSRSLGLPAGRRSPDRRRGRIGPVSRGHPGAWDLHRVRALRLARPRVGGRVRRRPGRVRFAPKCAMTMARSSRPSPGRSPRSSGTEDRAAWGLIYVGRMSVRWLVSTRPANTSRRSGNSLYGRELRSVKATIRSGDIGRCDFPHLRARTDAQRPRCRGWGRSANSAQLPGFGFANVGRGHQAVPEPQRWDTDGLVSSRAERVEVTTPVGTRPAIVLTVPSHGFGLCKAFVAFLSGEEKPLSLTAFDEDGEAFATLDLEPT